MDRYRYQGMTLLELMIVVVVAGLLLGLGMPALDRTVAESRATTATNRLVGSLHFARDASIRLGRPVSLCPSRDGRRCLADTRAWADGWIIYQHQSRHGHRRLQDKDQILRVVDAPTPGLQANRQVFTLRSDGRRSTNGTLRICHPGETTATRAVIVNVLGRVRSTRDPARMPSPAC